MWLILLPAALIGLFLATSGRNKPPTLTSGTPNKTNKNTSLFDMAFTQPIASLLPGEVVVVQGPGIVTPVPGQPQIQFAVVRRASGQTGLLPVVDLSGV